MTSLSDPRDLNPPIVNYDEPPVKPPPLLLVGPIAWVRKNLFSSPLDAILTLVGALVIVGVITSFISWAVGDANWYAITINLRLFMVGRYETAAEWRLVALVLYVAFALGIAFAAWSRISPRAWIAIGVVVALLFILPPVIKAIVPLPPSYLGAGNIEITSGSAKATPQPQLAFIGKAGDTINLSVATELSGGDDSLRTLAGFGDETANQLRNAAGNRLDNIARKAEIEADLAGDLLTPNQRERLTAELGKLAIPDTPVSDSYTVNQTPVKVRILRGTTGDLVGEATLDSSSPSLIVTLPEDGWYVLEKTVDDSTSADILRVQGIYPLLERSLTQSGDITIDESGQSSVSATQRVSQYVRMMDSFTTEEARPTADGKNVPMAQIIDQQFRGTHRFGDYLSLFVGPFLGQINMVVLIAVIALLAGYIAGGIIDRTLSPREKPRRASGRTATWLLIVAPILMFVFVYGAGNILPLTDTTRWGGLLLTIMLTVVGIIASFPFGVLLALGRRSSLPVISTFCTLYIEFVRGVPLITVLFMAQLLVPLINPALASTPGAFRAMAGIVLFSAAYLAENVRGGLQSIPPGQEEAAKALGLAAWQITLFITLPQALRAVIPALVGQFISLFKDTSLVAIVGLLDLVGMAKNVVAQTEFLQRQREVYTFIVIVYFIFSYSMSTLSKRIEASGAGKALARKI
jgi:His/Glu/Gln/Arg/opine family amino acid ABC transporter permease subunit